MGVGVVEGWEGSTVGGVGVAPTGELWTGTVLVSTTTPGGAT